MKSQSLQTSSKQTNSQIYNCLFSEEANDWVCFYSGEFHIYLILLVLKFRLVLIAFGVLGIMFSYVLKIFTDS